MAWKKFIPFFLIGICVIIIPSSSVIAQNDFPIPALPDDLVQEAANPEELSLTVAVVILLAILSLAPAIIMMVTSFVRIAVVISFTRTALATQQMPPNQVIMALSLFLTFFVMAPTFETIYEEAIVPYQNNEIAMEDLFDKGIQPIRDFMFKQMQGDHDLQTLADMMIIAGVEQPMNQEDVPTWVLIPTFMLTELAKAFKIGILIFIPFIIIDMIVSAILMSMGMIMLPPVMVSLPFKIILFVIADGWNLIVINLLKGFVV